MQDKQHEREQNASIVIHTIEKWAKEKKKKKRKSWKASAILNPISNEVGKRRRERQAEKMQSGLESVTMDEMKLNNTRRKGDEERRILRIQIRIWGCRHNCGPSIS
jgi:hypothetical protein